MPNLSQEIYDVSRDQAQKAKPHERKGIVRAVGSSDILVQPNGSTRNIHCEFRPDIEVGDWVTILWVPGTKRRIISSSFKPPKTVDVPKFQNILDQSQSTSTSVELNQIILDQIGDSLSVLNLIELADVSASFPLDGEVLTWVDADSRWENRPASGGFDSPMTTEGDLIFENATPEPDRLPIGDEGKILGVVSGLPAWINPASSGTILTTNLTPVGNIGSGEDNLISYTLPANSLFVDGNALHGIASVQYAANANTKQLKAKFGATTFFDSGALGITLASDAILEYWIYRITSSTQIIVAKFTLSYATGMVKPQITSASEDLTGTVVLKCTGEATTTDDISQRSLHLELLVPSTTVVTSAISQSSAAIMGKSGTLAVASDFPRVPNRLGRTLILYAVRLDVNTAPVGSAIIVDILKNGTTIFTNPTNRPQITAGSNDGETTTIDIPSWDDGDYLQFTIEQVGSTTPGSTLTVTLAFN